MIQVSPSHLHWNYFLALEKDLEIVSRYIEFNTDNFSTYSIELSRLLLSSASEVDVVAKLLCNNIDSTGNYRNIDDYRKTLTQNIPDLHQMKVSVPRYGLEFKPWEKWGGEDNPIWWRGYNNVKHQRNFHFDEANLKNVLNSLGALLILNFHYYSRELSRTEPNGLSVAELMDELQPRATLLRLNNTFF